MQLAINIGSQRMGNKLMKCNVIMRIPRDETWRCILQRERKKGREVYKCMNKAMEK